MKAARFSNCQADGSSFTGISNWFLVIAVLLFCFMPTLHAQGPPSAENSGSSTASLSGASANNTSSQPDAADVHPGNGQSAQESWVSSWLRMVDKTRTEQPHYVAPLVTTHVLLVQQYRFDSSWQTNANGSSTDNYGNGHGLEIIPNSRFEVQVAQPPYIVNSAAPSGAGDTSLFVKFRAASAPEGNGEYFVGLFLGASFPTGSAPNGAGHSDPFSDACSGERLGTIRCPEHIRREPAYRRCSSSGSLVRLEHGISVQHQRQDLANDRAEFNLL